MPVDLETERAWFCSTLFLTPPPAKALSLYLAACMPVDLETKWEWFKSTDLEQRIREQVREGGEGLERCGAGGEIMWVAHCSGKVTGVMPHQSEGAGGGWGELMRTELR